MFKNMVELGGHIQSVFGEDMMAEGLPDQLW